MGKFNLETHSDSVVSLFTWNMQNKSAAREERRIRLDKSIDLNKSNNKKALRHPSIPDQSVQRTSTDVPDSLDRKGF